MLRLWTVSEHCLDRGWVVGQEWGSLKRKAFRMTEPFNPDHVDDGHLPCVTLDTGETLLALEAVRDAIKLLPQGNDRSMIEYTARLAHLHNTLLDAHCAAVADAINAADPS